MKCIKDVATGRVARVDDGQAREMVKRGQAVYCPKGEYKQQNRKGNK